MPFADLDCIARFLSQRNDFLPSTNSVKPRAFLPQFNKETRRWDRSVFRTHGLELSETQQLAAQNGLEAKAFGWLTIDAVRQAGLAFEDDSPPERHGLLVGWPGNDSDDDKPQRLDLAVALAQSATLVRY